MKIKIFSEDLKLGMYISELDHPWIESPFLFQGFLIKEDQEIEQVRATCKYVYVDTEKTPFEVKVNLETIHPPTQKSVKKKNSKSIKYDFTDTVTLKKANFDKTSFTEHLIKARKTRDKTRGMSMQCLLTQGLERLPTQRKLKY